MKFSDLRAAFGSCFARVGLPALGSPVAGNPPNSGAWPKPALTVVGVLDYSYVHIVFSHHGERLGGVPAVLTLSPAPCPPFDAFADFVIVDRCSVQTLALSCPDADATPLRDYPL